MRDGLFAELIKSGLAGNTLLRTIAGTVIFDGSAGISLLSASSFGPV
jgi:hypothetical protein